MSSECKPVNSTVFYLISECKMMLRRTLLQDVDKYGTGGGGRQLRLLLHKTSFVFYPSTSF